MRFSSEHGYNYLVARVPATPRALRLLLATGQGRWQSAICNLLDTSKMFIVKKISFIFLLPIHFSWAALTIHNLETGEKKQYLSAVFKYFSEYEDEILENYPVVFLEGDNLCSPTRGLVDGKVVLANLKVGAKVNCWPTDAATACAQYDAVAFVNILSHPPGLFSNMHFTFNPDAESIGIPYGSIAAADVGNDELDLWRSTNMNYVVVTLGPPYDYEYTDLFKSPLWLAVFQIALPAFALLVLSESIVEIRRRIGMHLQNNSLKRQQGLPNDRKMLSSAPLLICIIEAISCAAIGAILALGQFGPFYLPFNYHYFFLFLLTGSSFFSTLISALILHEKSKFVVELPTCNDISAHYQKTIIACGVLCIGPDIVIGFTFIDPRTAYGNFTSFYGIYGIGQIIVAIYFLVQARGFYKPLLAYLTHPESHPRPENEAQIRSIARILTLSSSAMLLNTSTMVFMAIRATEDVRKTNVYVWFTAMLVFSASCIGTSYCQVKLVSSNNGCLVAVLKSLKRILRNLLTRVPRLCARHYQVQDDHHPAPSAISKSSVTPHECRSSEIEVALDPIPWFYPSAASRNAPVDFA